MLCHAGSFDNVHAKKSKKKAQYTVNMNFLYWIFTGVLIVFWIMHCEHTPNAHSWDVIKGLEWTEQNVLLLFQF